MSIANMLVEYGILLVFVNVLLVQLGVPIPAVPGLVIAGGLAAAGQLDPVLIVTAAVMASTMADYAWYRAGRRSGYTVLFILRRLSMSPERCLPGATSCYRRWGARALLFAKFIPGAATIASPMAGVLRMPCHVFLLCTGTGALLWAASFVTLGFVLNVQGEMVLASLDELNPYMTWIVAAALAILIVACLLWRRRELEVCDVAKLNALQVQAMMSGSPNAALIDVRSPMVRELDGRQLPGAVVSDIQAPERTLATLSRTCSLVIFCACPNEVTSASAATRFKRLGYPHVYVLENGIDCWEAAGLAVHAVIPCRGD